MNLNESKVDPVMAAQETKNWREYYAKGAYLLQPNPGEIPESDFEKDAFRGFRIPLDSLTALKEVIEEYNKNPDPLQGAIDSVRVYLAKRTSAGVPPTDEDIHVYMTPIVKGGGVFIPGQDFGRDLLYFAPKDKPTEPAVFDFSQPCPKQCDTLSILYGAPEKQPKPATDR